MIAVVKCKGKVTPEGMDAISEMVSKQLMRKVIVMDENMRELELINDQTTNSVIIFGLDSEE